MSNFVKANFIHRLTAALRIYKTSWLCLTRSTCQIHQWLTRQDCKWLSPWIIRGFPHLAIL